MKGPNPAWMAVRQTHLPGGRDKGSDVGTVHTGVVNDGTGSRNAKVGAEYGHGRNDMGKMPGEQQSTEEKAGGGTPKDDDQGLNLEDGLGEDEDVDEDEDDDDDDDDESSQQSGGSADLDDKIEELFTRMTSEIDRRINGALNTRQRREKKAGTTRETEGKGGQPVEADVRTARLSMREALPTEIRFLSAEERKFATDLGRLLITDHARRGFDDPDEIGEEVASEVAKQVKSLRDYYSGRTKSLLKKQGALVEQQSGQQSGGSNPPPGQKSKGVDRAKNIREELATRRP